MRYQIVAVGTPRRGFARNGIDFYAKRLSAYGKTEFASVHEGKQSGTAPASEQEARALLRAANGYVVSIDERGTARSSVELAERITALETSGISRLSLLVGGAGGHGAAVREAAAESWSLSRLTLPHELAQLVLVEQLYRAETIRAGHPYHRE